MIAAAPWSLVTYRDGDRERVAALRVDGAIVVAEPVADCHGAIDVLAAWSEVAPALRAWDPARSAALGDVDLLAPLRFPPKLICAGANYASHLAEMGVSPADDRAPAPFFFLKPPTSTVIGHRQPIQLPSGSPRVDWEGELAVVIGRQAAHVSPEDAPDHVAAYTIVNDVSARAHHRRRDSIAPPFEFDWLGSKGRDTFCPMGPGLTPSWFVPDPHDLTVRLWVNGDLKQDCATSDMLVGVWDLIASASEIMTLEPGDVIATGTPPGVGAARGEWLAAGDEVAVEIAGLGRLVNPVEQADPRAKSRSRPMAGV